MSIRRFALMLALLLPFVFSFEAKAGVSKEKFENCMVMHPDFYAEQFKCVRQIGTNAIIRAIRLCLKLVNPAVTDIDELSEADTETHGRCTERQVISRLIVLGITYWVRIKAADYRLAKKTGHPVYFMYDRCIGRARPNVEGLYNYRQAAYCFYKDLIAALVLGHLDEQTAVALLPDHKDVLGSIYRLRAERTIKDFPSLDELIGRMEPHLVPDSRIPD